MIHTFDTNIAEKYGVHSAILLNNIYFWIEKNKANGSNYYNGSYWTFNSKKAFSELFPYMTARQIDYALKKLIDEGVLITGNFNKVAYDRTLWYAITKKGYSILQNCEMEDTKVNDGNSENVQPIPDVNSDINPVVTSDINVYVPDTNVGNTPSEKPKKPVKHKYGEYQHVLLTDEEVEKLRIAFGEELTDEAVVFLDEYIEMKGYKAKNHYLAIRKWVIDAVKEKRQKEQRQFNGRNVYTLSNGDTTNNPFFADLDSMRQEG